MPELPDLEVFKKNLKRKLVNKKLEELKVNNERKVTPSEKELKEAIRGTNLQDIERYGKELQFIFDNNNVLNLHLMLKGEMKLASAKQVPEIRQKIMTLTFEGDHNLVIFDPRMLCKIHLNPILDTTPDALSPEFTFDYFKEKAIKYPRKNIKAFIVDQSIVKGIGNAYSDEILYDANISPKSKVGAIPEDILLNLFNSISKVLLDAKEKIIELEPERISGEERRFLKVHNPEIQETDKGETILIEKIDSKPTYYTKEQEVYE